MMTYWLDEALLEARYVQFLGEVTRLVEGSQSLRLAMSDPVTFRLQTFHSSLQVHGISLI